MLTVTYSQFLLVSVSQSDYTFVFFLRKKLKNIAKKTFFFVFF